MASSLRAAIGLRNGRSLAPSFADRHRADTLRTTHSPPAIPWVPACAKGADNPDDGTSVLLGQGEDLLELLPETADRGNLGAPRGLEGRFEDGEFVGGDLEGPGDSEDNYQVRVLDDDCVRGERLRAGTARLCIVIQS